MVKKDQEVNESFYEQMTSITRYTAQLEKYIILFFLIT